jgi:hypothetical protein
LFDSYPRLFAAFRALQSLLTPRHPPCALGSLTTRIECSRAELTRDEREAATPRIIARLIYQCHKTPGNQCKHHPRCNVFFSFLSLGRTPPSHPFQRKSTQRHSIQDASYHNRIVKERNKPTSQGPHHHRHHRCESIDETVLVAKRCPHGVGS